MCGRFTLRSPAHVLMAQFGLSALPPLNPRYNIAPTQPVLTVRTTIAGDHREAMMAHWGLVPSWAQDPSIGQRMINARQETISEKPSFRSAFRRRRCLVLADGYYEWQKTGTRKQPFHIHQADEQPFAFAGLWESWSGSATSADDLPWLSCTIVTTAASPALSPIHDRMPVIVPPSAYRTWLDSEQQDAATIAATMATWDVSEWCCDPVDTYVNRPQHDDPRCLQPAE